MDTDIKQTILGYNRAVPRYTSYPTAPHFKECAGEGLYKNWISALTAQQSLSLYIHVPFCPKLCWFCGCNTKITQRETPVIEYVDLLKQEMKATMALLPKGMAVSQIHFGGGSPTILTPLQFEEIMRDIRADVQVSADAEISVEIDPRNFDEALAVVYARCGVTRVSFGVQDFDEKVMAAVNRPQLFNVVYKGIELARSYGIGSVNIDLMYGLPYQNAETMKRLAEATCILAPDRIALFGYAHVPWMKKHMRLIAEDTLPDNATRYDLFEIAAGIFEEAGYEAIGIDHFAKPDDTLSVAQNNGRLHRNFQGYTAQKTDVLIGFGASAVSQLPQGYIQNTVHMPQYRDRVEAGILPAEKYCERSPDDNLRADIIEELMCKSLVDVQAVCRRYGKDMGYVQASLDRLKEFDETGLVQVDAQGRIVVRNRFMVRLVCAAFDAYLKPPSENIQRHVSAI